MGARHRQLISHANRPGLACAAQRIEHSISTLVVLTDCVSRWMMEYSGGSHVPTRRGNLNNASIYVQQDPVKFPTAFHCIVCSDYNTDPTVDNYKDDVAITTCSDGSYCCGYHSFDCCDTHRGYWIVDGVVTRCDPNSTSSSSTSSRSSSSLTSTSSSSRAISTPATSTYTLLAALSTASQVSTPTIVSCSDSLWEPNPQNWADVAVDRELASWWSKTTSERGSRTFDYWISSSFGDKSRDQHCGIGTGSSCSAPDCQSKNFSMTQWWIY